MNRLLKFFVTSTVIYLAFLVRGLHNHHYLDWSVDFQIGDCIEILVFAVPFIYFPLKLFSRPGEYLNDSVWFAVCLSVPFAIYDSLYLGWWKGHGIAFLSTYWFLSIYYFIMLVEPPIIGYLMQRNDRRITRDHLIALTIAVAAWLLNAWEGAASDHYFDWSLNMKMVRLTNVALLAFSIAFILSKSMDARRNRLFGSFLAFYFSVVFIVFDFFYLGVAKRHGLGYVVKYWFVNAYHPIFWLAIPIGWLAGEGRDRALARRVTVEDDRSSHCRIVSKR